MTIKYTHTFSQVLFCTAALFLLPALTRALVTTKLETGEEGYIQVRVLVKHLVYISTRLAYANVFSFLSFPGTVRCEIVRILIFL